MLHSKPTEYFPLFEAAAKQAADQVTAPREDGSEDVHDIQVTVKSQANPTPFRKLGASHVSKLVKVSGIVVSASTLKVKGTKLTVKQGQTVKKIRVTNDPEQIDCKVDGISITLLTCFVRKVQDKKGKKKR